MTFSTQKNFGSFKHQLCCVICIFFASNSFAEIESLSENIPKLVITTNKQVEIVYPDGRVAQILASNPKSYSVSVKSEIVENTCDQKFKKLTCDYTVDFSPEVLKVVWLKNHDKNKIGKTLITEDDQLVPVSNPWLWELNYSQLFNFGETKKSNNYIKKVKSGPSLICNNMDWVKNLPSFDNERLTIAEWAVETNSRNLETNLNENMIAETYMDVEALLNQNKLTVKNIGYFSKAEPGDFVTLSIADILGWSLRDKNNKICEISIKSDSASLLNTLIEILEGNSVGSNNILFEPLKNINKLEDLLSYLSRENLSDSELSPEDFTNKEDYLRVQILNALEITDLYFSDTSLEGEEQIEVE